MGIGHFAVGLALKRAEPRVNLGLLVFAAFLSDFLLGVFAWLGVERYDVPADLATKHYFYFTFPYSHGLAATLLWSSLAGAVVLNGIPRAEARLRWRAAWIAAGAVLSHFVLDALVHVKGLPLLGEDSLKLGLGLWNHLPLELSLEVAMTLAGLLIYLRCTRAVGLVGRYGMVVFLALLTPALMLGQLSTTKPPENGQAIAGWLIAPVVLAMCAFLLDRGRKPVHAID